MAFPEKLSVVLVDTLYGGNLGAVARAMANFGLTDLTLVRPAERIFDDPQLKPMARKAAVPILAKAEVHSTLPDALSDTELSLGFTNRLGKNRTDGLDLKDAIEMLSHKGPLGRVAAVFGSEDKGLSNEDLEKCSLLVRIPADPGMQSLNLSQAVGIFAYEVYNARLFEAPKGKKPRNLATNSELEGLYAHLEEVLQAIHFIEEKSPARMMNYMRRFLSRRMPGPRDVAVLRGILSKVELTIERARAGID